jgi:DTW domain-containing protein YfiP
VDNRTGVFILQHPRERFHPLGTARIARLGLRRFTLEVAWGLTHELALPPRTGLLYPGPGARRLGYRCSSSDRPPENLLLIDGTWAHTRQLLRANPWLHELPRYRLVPDAPSRYRVRSEPDRNSLSTIEAIVQALQILEPRTAGLLRLLDAFEELVSSHLASRPHHPSRRRRQRRRPPRPIPPLLSQAPRRVIVTYGESVVGATGGGRELVQWSAKRLGDGATFECMVTPASPIPNHHLAHMGLCGADFAPGTTLSELARDWAAFCGPDAVLAAWNRSSLALAESIPSVSASQRPPPGIELKAVYCNLIRGTCGSLGEVMATEGLTPASTPFKGRAAGRMGNAVAMARHLAGC